MAASSAPLARSFGPITLLSCCTQAPSLPDGTNPIHAILASLPGPRPASCTAELALENAFAITTHGSSRNRHLHAQCNDHGLRCRYVMAAQYVERAAFLLAPQDLLGLAPRAPALLRDALGTSNWADCAAASTTQAANGTLNLERMRAHARVPSLRMGFHLSAGSWPQTMTSSPASIAPKAPAVSLLSACC